ncbi:hypothetical protein D9M68_505610 [compost metagenome]
MVAVQGTGLTRPGIDDYQVAFGRTVDQVAQVVHQRRLHAEEGPRGGARLQRMGARQRGHQAGAGFGLPPGVDDRTAALADVLVVPVPGFRVDRLTHRTQQAQAGAIGAFDRGPALGHHGANGSRRSVEDVHLVLVDDLRHTGDIRVVRHAFEHQSGGAIGQGAVDQVGVAGHPADVGGAPEDFARAVVEHALVGQRGIDQVAAGGVQHALGLTGGAGGVEDEQRVLGAHFLRRAGAAGDLHQVLVPDVAMRVPLDLAAGALDHDDLLHAAGLGVGQRVVDIGLQRRLLAATQALVGGDHHLGAAVDDAAGQGLGGEAAEHHGVDGADAGTGQHGNHGFRDHRHVDGHHVAAVHVLAAQGVGELADLLVQFAVGDFLVLGRVVAFPDDRHLVATGLQVPVQAVGGDVEGAVGEPLDVDVVIVEGGLLHLGEGFDPVQALGLFTPESIGVDDRLLVHGFVGRFVGEGLGGHFRADRIQRSSTHGSYLGG